MRIQIDRQDALIINGRYCGLIKRAYSEGAVLRLDTVQKEVDLGFELVGE